MQSERLPRIMILAQWSCAVLTALVIVMQINRGYPSVGHDYRYFIPRLLDTKLHLLLNGPSIQWYTPSFGGGLPAFPNPQHMEYSLIQLLTLILNPWAATLASTFIISLIGFMVFARLLEQHLGLQWTSSTLGAIFFIGNGFFIEHMIVGHLGYQLFPLGAILLCAALDHSSSLAKSVGWIALIVAMMVHQAGFYLIIILCLSLWIALPLIYLLRPRTVNAAFTVRALVFGFLLGGLVAASKIYAVLSMMRLFPRQVSDFYAASAVQSVIGVIAQFFGVMFFAPLLLLTGHDPSQISGALANLTGSNYLIWETDISISPLLILLLVLAFARLISLLRRRLSPASWPADRIIALVLLVTGVWLCLEITTARGLIYPHIRYLPILQSLHINVRFAAALIIPLVIFGAAEYDRRVPSNIGPSIFAIAAVVAIASLLSYELLSPNVHFRIFDLTPSLKTDAAIGGGDHFFVDQVADFNADEVFLNHATSLTLYEPLFSDFDPKQNAYVLKNFDVRTHIGPVSDSDGTYFNMTNPASLVFPTQNHLRPFELIKVTEADKLTALIQRRQPEWVLPTVQVMLDWLSLVAFLLDAATILWFALVRRAAHAPEPAR